MFYGLILICLSGATEYNIDTCTLYKSPNVYNSVEQCTVAIQEFLSHEGFKATIKSGFDLVNIECHNVIPESLQGQRL